MAKTNKMWARRPIGYGGKDLDHGQLFVLADLPNDEKLVRLGYVAPFEGGNTYPCRLCGEHFISANALNAHGDKRHTEREIDPDQEDALAEREERDMTARAPLYMDKTTASRT